MIALTWILPQCASATLPVYEPSLYWPLEEPLEPGTAVGVEPVELELPDEPDEPEEFEELEELDEELVLVEVVGKAVTWLAWVNSKL